MYSIYNHIGCHLFLQNDSLNSDSWKQSILDKIEELENDTSLLCFKGAMSSTLKDEKIDFTDLETLIKEELIKLEDIKKQNGMSDDDEAFKVEFNFELVSPFPRYQVPIEKTVTVKEVSQLWPNGSLLIEEIVDEEESSEEESGSEEQE